jgi:hypothetical protein
LSILALFPDGGFVESVERFLEFRVDSRWSEGVGHEDVNHGGVVGEVVNDVASMLRLIVDAGLDGAGDASNDGGLLKVVNVGVMTHVGESSFLCWAGEVMIWVVTE